MTLNTERIREMEAAMNECSRVLGELSEKLDRLEELRGRMTGLFDYYGSDAWYEDREAFAAAARGDVPADLTAGVLSEDLVYDEITEVRDLAFRMMETGTDILKNWL